MKRRSPPSCSFSGEPSTKKLFCDQEDLSHYGFSAVPIPLNLNSLVNKRRSFPVLRRCVSDPYRPPAPAPPTPAERGSGLPPLPPGLRRSVSDLSTPSPSLNAEETATPDSVKLRRMKERLKEMRQWWDEVMKDDEEENVREEEECIAAEDEKVLPQDDLGAGDSEEAVSVEWAEKCLLVRKGSAQVATIEDVQRRQRRNRGGRELPQQTCDKAVQEYGFVRDEWSCDVGANTVSAFLAWRRCYMLEKEARAVGSNSAATSQGPEEEPCRETIPSGLGILVSNRERGTGNDSVLQVDVVTISSNILSGNNADANDHDARRNGRRLFWDAFSRRSSRRLGDSPTIVFSTVTTVPATGNQNGSTDAPAPPRFPKLSHTGASLWLSLVVVFFRTGVSGSSGSVVGGGGGGGAILLRVQRLVLVLELELVLPFARFRLDATDLEKTSAVVSEEEASERAAAGRGLGARLKWLMEAMMLNKE
ncbi:uncharacterized protein HKW66_Vig0110390 [Vigna angularis]|uniref:Uncharacterized protein n=1 Tax=Phaseolus angularis TaxID=3914 RepID=A0A8T0KVZ0_PHAAN|nr:uncharacterized protein HKW66_Vig0110390 [Vigna angularis]